jgi:phosphonate transport system permease protein
MIQRNPLNHKIIVHPVTRGSLLLNGFLFSLFLITVFGFFFLDTKGIDLIKATLETFDNFRIMIVSPIPVASHFGVADGEPLALILEALRLLVTTLALGFLTTIIGGLFALVLGLLAAKNLTNDTLSSVIKGLVAVIRSVPTIVWVLIFAIGAGLGSVAAVIGMSFHTIGYLTKAYSESFEEIDDGTIEALRASGATWLQVVFQAVLPMSSSSLLSWSFVRFEINFSVAVAMGAAAGAGGLGYNLLMSTAYYYNIKETGFLVYLIVFVAILMEVIATNLKSSLKKAR